MLGPILVGLLGLVQPSGIPDFKPPEFADARRLYFSGQFREAGERFRATDRAYRARFGHPAPIYLGYLGLCHQALGEYDEAEAIFGEALAVIERLEGIPEPLADMLVNLATIRALRRDHPEALRLFDRALALLDRADANNERPGERWWLTGRIHARRAQSLITLGRHGEARRILTEMLGRRSQFRDRMANFELLESAGSLHEVLAELPAAQARYREALREARLKDGEVFNPALVVSVLRRLSNLTPPEESLRLLREAIEASRGYGTRALEIDSRVSLAERLIALGSVEVGVQEAREAAEMARTVDLPWLLGEAEIALARGLLAQGDAAGALSLLRPLASANLGVGEEWALQTALSDAYAAAGDRKASVEAAERAFAVFAGQDLGAIRDDTQAAFWAAVRPRLETTLERVLSLESPDAPSRALELVTRVRARAFLAARRLGAQEGSELGAIESEMARLARRLRAERNPLPMRAQLSRRLAVLEARWRTLGEGRAGSPSGLEQSAGALKPGEWDAVLIFFVGERNSYRFTVDDAGTRVDRLPGRRALGRAVENFRWPADGGQILVTGRASLGQMLIPRLASPGDRPLRLLILPDELLAAVPFEALEVQGRYLIETAVVAYAIAGLPGPFAFARRPPLSFFAGDPGLEAAGAERASLLETWPPPLLNVYSGQEATREAFRKAIERPGGIVHVATHALADPATELASSITLRPGAGDDGVLYLAEIARTRAAADLVVLAACDTGSGRHVGSEGAMSLGRAFLASGAGGVVTSQWPVSDVATSRLMQEFYRDLVRGLRPDVALRAAKLKMLSSPSGRDREPEAWAGFTLVLAPPSAPR